MEDKKLVEQIGSFYKLVITSVKEDKTVVLKEKEVKTMLSDNVRAFKKQFADKLISRNVKEEKIYESEALAYKELIACSSVKFSIWKWLNEVFASLPADVQKTEVKNNDLIKLNIAISISNKNIANNKIKTLIKPIESVVINTQSIDEESIEKTASELEYNGKIFCTKKDLEIYLDCIERYNQKYVFMDLEGTSVISEIVTIKKKNTVNYKHRTHAKFLEATCDDIYYVEDRKGNPRKMYFNQEYLENKEIRVRFSNAVFNPDPEFDDDTTYNFWKGFVEPRKGDVSKFINHVDKLIVGTKEQKMHLIKQLAWSVRFPHDNFGVVPAFRGSPGCGKSTLSETFMAICPNHSIMTSDLKSLLEGFNGETVYIKYFLGEEALWGGDKALEGKFKHAVTGETRAIEIKGVTKFYIDNHSQFILTTNEKWVMPVGRGDRRGEIFDCTETMVGKENHPYFADYKEWLYGEGKHALVYYFMYEIDLEGFNPRELVETKAKLDVKLTSLGHVAQFLYNALSGDISDGSLDKWTDIEIQPKRQDLFEIFQNNSRSKVTIREFSQTMAEIFNFDKNWKDNWKSSSRGSYYKLGTLQAARLAFCSYIKAEFSDVFGENESLTIVQNSSENNVIQIKEVKAEIMPVITQLRRNEPVIISKGPTLPFSLKR